MQPDNDTSGYSINHNTYYYYPVYGTNFNINIYNCNPVSTNFSSWQAKGFDINGSYIQSGPNYTEVIVQPNRYDSGRANIIIYNWNKSSYIDVNLSGVLQVGSSFEIRDVQDYFGSAIVKGIFNGSNVAIPMDLSNVINYTGNFTGAYHNLSRIHTSSEFGVFMLLPYREPESGEEPPAQQKNNGGRGGGGGGGGGLISSKNNTNQSVIYVDDNSTGNNSNNGIGGKQVNTTGEDKKEINPPKSKILGKAMFIGAIVVLAGGIVFLVGKIISVRKRARMQNILKLSARPTIG